MISELQPPVIMTCDAMFALGVRVCFSTFGEFLKLFIKGSFGRGKVHS